MTNREDLLNDWPYTLANKRRDEANACQIGRGTMTKQFRHGGYVFRDRADAVRFYQEQIEELARREADPDDAHFAGRSFKEDRECFETKLNALLTRTR